MKISTVSSGYTSAANVDRLKRILCTPFILMYVFLVLSKCILNDLFMCFERLTLFLPSLNQNDNIYFDSHNMQNENSFAI